MDNTPVIVPVSKLKTHAISAGLTFLSVFLPVAALTLHTGLDTTSAFTTDAIIALGVTVLRTAGKAAVQALLLEEISFWKKEVDEAKANGQTTTLASL